MNNQERILLVVNPVAGGTDKTELIDIVSAGVGARGASLEVYETSCDYNNEQKIKDLVRDIAPQRVLVAGGDGTIQLVAGILMDTETPMGVLPAGSANGFAVSLDIPPTIEEQLAIALGNNVVDTDILEIDGHICIHLADLGVNAELVKNYEQGNIRGKLGYVLQSIPSLISADFPYTFNIEANGQQYTWSGILLVIANADKFGTGAIINPTGKINDGKFEVIVFKNFDVPAIIKTLNGQLTPDMDFVDIISTDHAVITTTDDVPFQVDGEFIGNRRKTVAKVAKNKVKLALPPSAAI